MNAISGVLCEADLHGLVDGHLEADRRADALRKLAASPADRTLVEAWQAQNDLLRAAFHDVERERLPVVLDLAPPRLRCVESGPLEPLAPLRAPFPAPAGGRRRSAFVGAAALIVVAVGMAGAWLVGQSRDGDRRSVVAAPTQDPGAMLADRTVNELDAARWPAAAGLMRVPDLTVAGLRLTDVSAQPGEPVAMVLHYRDAGDGRVVLGVANAPYMPPTPATPVGRTIAWRRGGTAYALAGTLPAERLRKLARSLQDEAGQD